MAINKANTEVFNSEQSWTVPNYVNEVVIECFGESGKNGNLNNNYSGTSEEAYGLKGYGGTATGTLSVTPGDTLYIRSESGGGGAASGSGTSYPIEGNAGDGGNSADVRKNGTSESSIVIGAGGGGGRSIVGLAQENSEGLDAKAKDSGDVNEDGVYISDWPPDQGLAGSGGVFHAEANDRTSLSGGSELDEVHGDSIGLPGGGGGGYPGGEASSVRITDYNGTQYGGTGGAAGGGFNTSSVTNVSTGTQDTSSWEVKIHWEEFDREVKISEAGIFQQKIIYVSDGSTFTQPKNLHRSDGSSWNSKY